MKYIVLLLLITSSLLIGFIFGYYTNEAMKFEETKVYITDKTGQTVVCDNGGQNCEVLINQMWK